MKGLGFLIYAVFVFALACLPLVLLDARNLAGKFIRANALLIAVGAFFVFSGSDAKKPGPLLLIVTLVFALAFLKQVFQRRGIPIIESAIGISLYNASYSLTGSVFASGAAASLLIFALTLFTARKYPIRSHHEDN